MQRAFTVFMCLLLQCSAAQAQWASVSTHGVPRLPDGRPNLAAPAPRTADGKPDLSGIWAVECGIYGRDACFTQSLFFDLARNLKPGDVEMTPWAAAIQAQREKRNHVDDPYGYCLPPGVPRINFGGGPFKILQTPKATAILYETLVGMIFRQVFTDGRALPSSAEPTWLGYSVGRWDGDTFAVETTGFKDGGWLDTLKARPQRRPARHGAIPPHGRRPHGAHRHDRRSQGLSQAVDDHSAADPAARHRAHRSVLRRARQDDGASADYACA